MRRLPTAAVALSLLVIVLAACVSGYRAASVEANERAKAYATARVELDDLNSVGKLTTEQSNRYKEIRDAVRSAGRAHDTAITIWRQTGRKPVTYDAAAKALADAEQRMIALRDEVLR